MIWKKHVYHCSGNNFSMMSLFEFIGPKNWMSNPVEFLSGVTNLRIFVGQ